MFIAVLLILFAGDAAPEVMTQKSLQPFATRAACEEWTAQESRRIERIIETLENGKPEKWEMRCVPAAPERDA
jgi:hypothetical protein